MEEITNQISEVIESDSSGVLGEALGFLMEYPIVLIIAVVVLFILSIKLFWIRTIIGTLLSVGAFFVLPPVMVALSAFYLLGGEVIFTPDEESTDTYLILGTLVDITSTWNPIGGFAFRLFVSILTSAICGAVCLIPYVNFIMPACLILMAIKSVISRFRD